MAGPGLGTKLQPERLTAADCERRLAKPSWRSAHLPGPAIADAPPEGRSRNRTRTKRRGGDAHHAAKSASRRHRDRARLVLGARQAPAHVFEGVPVGEAPGDEGYKHESLS